VQCGALLTTPEAEVEDHVVAEPQGVHRDEQQEALEQVALVVDVRMTEERHHPLVRREAQGADLTLELLRARRLAGADVADHEVQRGHGHRSARARAASAWRWPIVSYPTTDTAGASVTSTRHTLMDAPAEAATIASTSIAAVPTTSATWNGSNSRSNQV
jgi:hypothetical protein